jgi:hypothetical protein
MIASYKKLIAIARLRFGLGLGIIGMFTSVIGMLTFAKVWEATFIYLNIPLILVYLALPIGFLISCWCIGYIYDVKGIWKEETSHVNMKLNPEFLTVLSSFETISSNFEIINSKLDVLQQEVNKLNAQHDEMRKE